MELDAGLGRPPGRTLSPLLLSEHEGVPWTHRTGLWLLCHCQVLPVCPAGSFSLTASCSSLGSFLAEDAAQRRVRSQGSPRRRCPFGKQTLCLSGPARGTRMVLGVRMESAALPLNLSQQGGIPGSRAPGRNVMPFRRGKSARKAVSSYVSQYEGQGKHRWRKLRDEAQTKYRAVAAATTNRMTCSLRYSLPCLFWTPFQEVRRLDPASFSLLPGPDVTVPGFFPREIR